jgi:hypothetical protein
MGAAASVSTLSLIQTPSKKAQTDTNSKAQTNSILRSSFVCALTPPKARQDAGSLRQSLNPCPEAHLRQQ